MRIKIIETETGDVLTPADTRRMRLPFRHGWSSWGLFDHTDTCVDSFTSYRAAIGALMQTRPPATLAA